MDPAAALGLSTLALEGARLQWAREWRAIGCLLTIINVQAEADCGQVQRRAKSACVIAFRSLSRINLAEKFIQLQSEATEACSKWENK